MLAGLAHQFFSLLLLLLVEARFGAGSGGLLGRLIRSCGKVETSRAALAGRPGPPQLPAPPHAPFADRWHFLDAAGNPVVARISGSLISSSYETMLAAAVAGIGLWRTVPFLVADLLASGALVPLLPGYRAQELEINALYPHRPTRRAMPSDRALNRMRNYDGCLASEQ
jgi:DNA-binding transcriptional LysR family regulator